MATEEQVDVETTPEDAPETGPANSRIIDPRDEAIADLIATVEALKARLDMREEVVEQAAAPTVAAEPRVEPQAIDPSQFWGVDGKLPTKENRPDLYAPMLELERPRARFPEEALFAVRLKGAKKDTGFYRAFPRGRRTVRLADPHLPLLVPKLGPSQMVLVNGEPPDALKNPAQNVIGFGDAVAWHVPGIGDCYCDPRAAAHERTRQIVKISLWCPLFELAPGSTHAHEEHGSFAGIGQEPDRVQALKWEPETEADEGRCLGCKGHQKKREMVRRTCEKARASFGYEDEE